MAAGVLMILVGIALASRLFRHDLAGTLATMNLDNMPFGSASSAAADTGDVAGPTVPGNVSGGPVGPALSIHGTLSGTPGAGTHSHTEGPDNWQSDNAIDINVPIGTTVLAPVSGTVVRVSGSWAGGGGRFDGYGITVRGADGNEFFLKHLSASSVHEGERVVQGQPIGKSGAGNGVPHLHLGQMRGNPLDTFGYR